VEVTGIGQRIKAERTRQGLDRTRLAEVAGVDANQLWKIEDGRVPNPRAATVAKIAAALGCPAAVLMGEEAPTPLTPLQKRALGLLENIPQRRIGEWFAFAGRLMGEDMEAAEDFLMGMTRAAS